MNVKAKIIWLLHMNMLVEMTWNKTNLPLSTNTNWIVEIVNLDIWGAVYPIRVDLVWVECSQCPGKSSFQAWGGKESLQHLAWKTITHTRVPVKCQHSRRLMPQQKEMSHSSCLTYRSVQIGLMAINPVLQEPKWETFYPNWGWFHEVLTRIPSGT
jgi:hypothetical protein